MSRKIVYAVLVAGAMAAVVGVARAFVGGDAVPARTVVVASASTRWPADALRDWADFADQVSVLRVVSEKQLPPTEDVVATGEGLVGRSVTARIESTIWRNPGSPAVDGVVTFTTWGWVAHDGQLTPMVDSSSVRIEVGDRVLAPLLLAPEGAWAPLSPGSVIHLVGGRTAFADPQRRSAPQLAETLGGRTPNDVGELLASTPPRPDASALRRLDADARATELARQS